MPTAVSAGACEEVFLSDVCPVSEFNVHKCVTFDAVYWQPEIVIDGDVYAKGVSMHAPDPLNVPDVSCRFFAQDVPQPGSGRVTWDVSGYDRFAATIGLAEANGGEPGVQTDGAVFRVFVDGVLRFDSGRVTFSTPPSDVSIAVAGGSFLTLQIDAIGSHIGDHTVWANARLRRSCPP